MKRWTSLAGLALLAACGPESSGPIANAHEPLREEKDIQGTAVYQQGMLPTSAYQHDGADVWAYEPNTNYGSDDLFLMGYNGAFGWPYLRFELSGIPEGATVQSATLEMYAHTRNCYGYCSQNAAAHRVLSAWSEGSLTYNNKPPDWNNGQYESVVYITSAGRWWSWNVTQMASAWVTNPSSNFGLAILPIDSLYDGDFYVWRSDDYADPATRPRLTVTYLLPEHRASFRTQLPPPPALGVGDQAAVQVVFRNDGADTWTDAAGYRLGSQGPVDNTHWGMERVPLSGPVAMGEEAAFAFLVQAPAQPGQYTFQWRMVHDGVQWFGDLSPPVEVTVSLRADGQPCADPGQCQNGLCVDGYCCDSSCVGPCRACDLAGREGQCSFVGAGQDPAGECPGDPGCRATCNGAGACAFPPASTRCAACARCNASGGCNQYDPADSDPAGQCPACTACPGNGPACAPVAAGRDPLADCPAEPAAGCGRTGDCDGGGACAFHPASVECAPERCQDGVHHPADFCDGQGSCRDSGSQTCRPYVCLDAVRCRTDCSQNGHCVAGSYCAGSACAAYLALGEPCQQAQECIDGFCADGVCCEAACDGACEACHQAGSLGLCRPVPDGQDPQDECPGVGQCGGVCDGARACRFPPAGDRCAPCAACDGQGFCRAFAPQGSDPWDDCAPCWSCSGQDASCRLVSAGQDPVGDCPAQPAESCGPAGACDGQGACRLWPAGTECAPAQCQAGLLWPADACDGQGACLDAGSVACGPFACDGQDACHTACQTEAECLPGHYCEPPDCAPRRALGEACTSSAQCLEGVCADGVCCQDACQGACRRCDLPGTEGTCGFTPDGLDPDQECGLGSPCGGVCDGAGGCRLPGEETACGPCARCDGAGACSVLLPGGSDPLDACGPCRVCAGDRDACVPVPDGEDPHAECPTEPADTCGSEGACDGRGQCRLWPAGTACGPQRCEHGLLARAPACDGAGICRLQEPISCEPYGCDGDWCAGPAGLVALRIEDEAGQPIGDRALTTDDLLALVAVGQDSLGASLGPVMASWSVEGGIGTALPTPASAVVFDPNRPGLGRVRAAHHGPEIAAGETGWLQVGPGRPQGVIPLEPEARLLPADGASATRIDGGPVRDADGNPVQDGTPVTLVTSLGWLTSADQDPVAPGLQRLTLDGRFAVALTAAASPGLARVRAFTPAPATAEGFTQVAFGDGRPVADAGPDLQARSGARVQLDGRGSWDPLDRPLQFAWSQAGGPAVALEGADGPEPAFTAPEVSGQETLVFSLQVEAGGQLGEPDQTLVLVLGAETDLPTAILGLEPASGPAPLQVRLDGSASHAAACCQLTGFVWSFSDDHPPLSGPIVARAFEAPGGYGVTLRVVDDQGRLGSAQGQILALDPALGSPPVLGLRVEPERGPAPLEVTLLAEASDPEGGQVSLEWDLGGGFLPGPALLAWSLPRPGHFPVRVRATDPDGLTSQQSALVSVSQDGLYPPLILSTPPVSARVGEELRHTPLATGSSPLGWSLGKLVGGELRRAPAGMRVDPLSGALSWTPLGDQVGPAEVSLVVRNAAGADLQDFVLEVEGPGASAEGCGCGAAPGGGGSAGLLGLGLLAWLSRRAGRPGPSRAPGRPGGAPRSPA
jgi:hypothetical protein